MIGERAEATKIELACSFVSPEMTRTNYPQTLPEKLIDEVQKIYKRLRLKEAYDFLIIRNTLKY